jgi:hypothetical protein
LFSTGRYIRSTWANSKGSEPPSAGFIAGIVALESVGAIGRAYGFRLLAGIEAVASHDLRLLIGGPRGGSEGVVDDADEGGVEAAEDVEEEDGDSGRTDIGGTETGREDWYGLPGGEWTGDTRREQKGCDSHDFERDGEAGTSFFSSPSCTLFEGRLVSGEDEYR